jgi:predicted O-methyltransferase YrrM
MVPFDWGTFLRETNNCYEGNFMKEMICRRERTDSIQSSMGRFDAAALYALVKIRKPEVAIETGSFRGMSSAFILKGMQDARLQGGKLFSIERRPDCGIGALIPAELRDRFVSVVGDVETLLRGSELPPRIDLFLHDSTHRYRHQMWEFEKFWPRINNGGVLVSHDIDRNASFVDFVSRTYVHDQSGLKDSARTSHSAWGAIGQLGFLLKGEVAGSLSFGSAADSPSLP